MKLRAYRNNVLMYMWEGDEDNLPHVFEIHEVYRKLHEPREARFMREGNEWRLVEEK